MKKSRFFTSFGQVNCCIYKKPLKIYLHILGLGLGYFGFTSINENTKSLEIGNLELTAQKDSESTFVYLLLGAGAIFLIGGVVGLTKK